MIAFKRTEGVYVAWIPEEQAAVALEIADGATRAAEVTVAALLQRALGSRYPVFDRVRDRGAVIAQRLLEEFPIT
jgi:L-asparaginase II